MTFNSLKTVTLLLILSFLCIGIGSLFGTHGMQIACIMALCINGIAYFFSDKIALRMSNAQPLHQETYPHIHAMVEELAHAMYLPKPKLWLITSNQANAFATGRNPDHASIALTTGLISILDQDELQGVIAHELSHVYNRDILIGTIAAVMASVVGYFSYSLRSAALWGSYRNDRKQSNPLLLFVCGMLFPLIATLIQLAISRSREYQADYTGAHATRDPLALASALKKLALHTKTATYENEYSPATALGIASPLCSTSLLNMFSTHPPMSDRIKRLESLHGKLF